MRGIYLRDGLVYIRYKSADGRIVRESTNQRTVRFAEKLLSKRKTDIAEGRYFPGFEQVEFKTLRRSWWEHHGRRTRSQFEYLLPRIKEKFDAMRARDITPGRVQEFLEKLCGKHGRPLGSSSKNHHRTILNSIFSFARKRELYDKNPVAVIPQFKEPPGRDRFLESHEIRALLDACDSEVRVAVLLLATTTLRKTELLARKWTDLVFENGRSYLNVLQTKTGVPKKVPLTQVAVDALNGLPSSRTNDYLFPSRPTTRFRKPARPHRWDIGKEFRAAAEATGLRNVRVHDLRHLGTTILLARGVPDNITRMLTGHKSRELRRYQHLIPQVAQTVDIIADEIFRNESASGLGKSHEAGGRAPATNDTATDTPPENSEEDDGIRTPVTPEVASSSLVDPATFPPAPAGGSSNFELTTDNSWGPRDPRFRLRPDRFLQISASMDESARELRAWATFAGLVLIVFVLYWTQAFVVPIALAALVAFVLTPAVTWLERRVGRVVAVLAVVALVFAFFGVIGWGLAHQFDRFAADLPEYRAHILAKLDDLRGANTPAAPDSLDKAVRDLTSKIDSQSISLGSLEVILGPVGTGAFVLIMVIFMLLERKTLRDRLLSLVGHGQLIRTTRAFEEAGMRVSRQLLLQSLVNLVYGAIITTGLWLLHVPYPFIWGGLAAVVRFIPYVGFAVAAGAPALMSVAALPNWNGPLQVLLLFACLEAFTSVVVETNLYANAAGVSQVALLISVAFWAWLWGPLGLLMATPLTVCLVVIGKHVPGLESVGRLMTDAPALAPEDGYYQRLLARDLADASELIDRYIKASPPRGVYDALLLPALNYAARDRIDERLSPDEENAVIDASRELLAYASDAVHRQEAPAGPRAIPATGAARLRLIGLPSSGAASELALAMLATFLDDLPIEVNIANSRLQVSELVAAIKDRQIGVVCFADLPPNSSSKTRYLVRRLRATLPDLAIVVARWAPPVLADEAPQVLRDAGATAVVTTFAETREFLSGLTAGPQPGSPAANTVHVA